MSTTAPASTQQTDINVGEYCYSVGSVEGVPFTACTSGSDIIILASNFQRVQLIPGSHYSSDRQTPVSCIDCSTDVGKIAAAYNNRIVIFEPTMQQPQGQQQQQQQQSQQISDNSNPRSSLMSNQSKQLNNNNNTNANSNLTKLDYKWVQTATFEADYHISVISLNLEGTKLITGGINIQMWHLLVYDHVTLDSLMLGQSSINGCKPQVNLNASDPYGDINSRCNHRSPHDETDNTAAYDQPSSDSTVENHQQRARGLSIVMQHLGLSGSNQLNHSSSSSNLNELAQQTAQQQSKDSNSGIQMRGNCSLVDPQNGATSAASGNSNDIKDNYKMCWQCVWRCLTANHVQYIKFSPDGTLFCSAGISDRLVKIWYESVTRSPQIGSPSSPTGVPSAFNAPTSPLGSRRPPPSLNPDRSSVNFSFIYIAHPRAVTGFSWRKTSKYTPRGSVANVLITSCQDNISRLWVQTLLPDDGLVNFNQLKGISDSGNIVSGIPRVDTQRHRQKLFQRLKKMKAFSQFKKRQTLLDDSLDELEKVANDAAQANTNLPSSLSAHDFHSYALCSTAVIPGLHFHLAGSMEAEFDFQSVASGKNPFIDLSSQVDDHNNSHTHFVVHSINNKEIQITRSIEQLLHDMLLRILKASQATNSPPSAAGSCSGSENDTDDLDDVNDTITAESSKKLRHKLCHRINKQRALAASGRTSIISDVQHDIGQDNFNGNRSSMMSNTDSGRTSPTSLVEEFDRNLESLLRKWQASADLLFNINPIDGTLTIWQVKYLDGEGPGSFRQVQIEKVSKVAAALPHYDATTMSIHMLSYSPSAYQDVKRAYLAVTGATPLTEQAPPPLSSLEAPDSLSINTDTTCTVGANNTIGSNIDQHSDPNIFIVTQHLSGTLGLWKLGFGMSYPHVQGVDLVTRITGLPMHASWLCDGLMIIDYNDNSIITRWIGDTEKSTQSIAHPLTAHPSRQQHLQMDGNLAGPSATSTSSGHHHLQHLPSLAEEFPTPPSELDSDIVPGAQQYPQKQQSFQEVIRVSRMAQNITILPQYHLKQLIELLAFGRLQRVKAILNHLVNCLTSSDPTRTNFSRASNGPPASSSNCPSDSTPGPWAHRSRTLSIVAHSPPAFGGTFDLDNPTIQQQVIEEIELDYTEVTSIRPLPLYSLLEADKEKPQVLDSRPITSDEFSQGFDTFMRSRSHVEETLDEILGQSTIDKLNKQKEMQQRAIDEANKGRLTSFNPRKAKQLTKMLTHLHLPGLSSLDQMHLLAVADAVAAFDASPSDISDLHNDYETGGGLEGENDNHGVSAATTIAIDSLDDCGLRFLTAIRQHVYLTKCLPINPRQQLKMAGIGSHSLIWAFHSETQEELISLLPCVQRNKPTWLELKEYGIGWWIRKIEVLRKLIEKVAQSAYQAKQDPLDAALFYLAMKKKTLVCALLKRVNCDKRLLKLFEQDFNDPANRKKALKNAYALLGLHRFEHAAAFFILAGSIWDAVEVCINNLNDIQLAMVLIRLHDSDLDTNIPNNLRKLLSIEILGSQRPTDLVNSSTTSLPANSNTKPISSTSAINQFVYNPAKAHQDSFLRSMAFWKLGDYLTAVHTLLEIDVGLDRPRPSLTSAQGLASAGQSVDRRDSDTGLHQQAELPTSGNVSVSASVFNFYLYLRDQPLVSRRRQQILEEQQQNGGSRLSHRQMAHNKWQRDRSMSSGELIVPMSGGGSGGGSLWHQQSTEASGQQVASQSTGQLCTLANPETYSTEAVASYERRLFFSTAHAYLDAGCPMLALEVLSRLPDKMTSSSAEQKNGSNNGRDGPSTATKKVEPEPEKSSSIFSAWDPIDDILSLRREGLEEPKFEISDDDDDDNDDDAVVGGDKKNNDTKEASKTHTKDDKLDSERQENNTQLANDDADRNQDKADGLAKMSGLDRMDFIMAQQLKFVSCVHLLLHELNTLAIGCEEEKLRLQLYIWLERSAQALTTICQYNDNVVIAPDESTTMDTDTKGNLTDTITQTHRGPKRLVRHSTLIGHQQQQQQQQPQLSLDHNPSSSSVAWDGGAPSSSMFPAASLDHQESLGGAGGPFSRQVSLSAHRQGSLHQQVSTTTLSTVNAAAPILTSMDNQRRSWLRSNEPVLRTMLTYCNLHAATDTSLTSVRQELLLLLEELK